MNFVTEVWRQWSVKKELLFEVLNTIKRAVDDNLMFSLLPTSCSITMATQSCALFEFILWGVCGFVVCSFGIIGNALSFAAFLRDRRLPATILVQALAFSDCALLALVLFTDCIPYICRYTGTCTSVWVSPSLLTVFQCRLQPFLRPQQLRIIRPIYFKLSLNKIQ